jgi:hypothetical protein
MDSWQSKEPTRIRRSSGRDRWRVERGNGSQAEADDGLYRVGGPCDSRGLLVRVGADQTPVGGQWNGPIDTETYEFGYAPIREDYSVSPGLEKPYTSLSPMLDRFGVKLPQHLRQSNMHLDPDYQHLTYGDGGSRARQIRGWIREGTDDFIIFYSALRADVHGGQLVYAITGFFVVDRLLPPTEILEKDRDINAHSRYAQRKSTDVVVFGRPGASGRMQRCIPFAELRHSRERATTRMQYRVRPKLLDCEWGGLSVSDGWVQRSAILPHFMQAPKVLRWLGAQTPVLLQQNN